jgi:hypothetical protein
MRLGNQVSDEGKVDQDMRKIHILWMAIFAVFAFSAFATSSAFAATWLVEGVAMKTGETLASETEGALELLVYESSTSSTVLTNILCSGIFDGLLVFPNIVLVEDLLNLAMEEIGSLESEDVAGTALNCEVLSDAGALTDCKAGTLASLWPDSLNLALATTWEITFEEMTGGVLLGIFPVQAGYHVECESLIGIAGTNLCTNAGGKTTVTWTAAMTSPVSVLGTFAADADAERGECEMGGAHVAEVGGSGNTWAGAELVRLATALD